MTQTVRVTPGSDGLLAIALFGEIDYNNAPEVVEAIGPAMAQTPPNEVRLDLSGVTFLDSSGIGVIVTVYRTATAAGARFRIVGPTRFVYEQLRLTGLADLFGVEPPPVRVP